MKAGLALSVVLCVGLFTATSSWAAVDPARQAKIDALAGRLKQTISLVSPGADVDAYEGRITAALDDADVECRIAAAAVQEASGMDVPSAAHRALLAVSHAVTRCSGGGTGALGAAGGLALGSGPTLGGGGGSNYQ